MTERITAWQCIGCGRIEGAQPCVGICEDRKAEFVDAADHDAALAALEAARRRAETLAELVRQIAHTTPRAGEWESAWLAFQQRARRAMAVPASGVQAEAAPAPTEGVTRLPGRASAPASGRGSRPARRPRGKRR